MDGFGIIYYLELYNLGIVINNQCYKNINIYESIYNIWFNIMLI